MRDLIPVTMGFLVGVEAISAVDFSLDADRVVMGIDVGDKRVEIAWRRSELDSIAFTDEALEMAVKKVVQGVLPRVIIGL